MQIQSEFYNALYHLFQNVPQQARPDSSHLHYFAGQWARIVDRAIEEGVRDGLRDAKRMGVFGRSN